MFNASMIYAVDEVRTERKNLIILALMYLGFWTHIIDDAIISSSLLSGFQVATLLMGAVYFSFILIRKWNLNRLESHLQLPKNKLGLVTLVAWFVLGLSIILSEVVRGVSPHVGVLYLIYVPLLFFYIIPYSLNRPIQTITRAVLYSGLVIIVLSLLFEFPTIGFRYEGITNNPNSLGMVANQTILAGLSLFYMEFQKKDFSKKKLLFYVLVTIIGMLPLFVSESRTSLLVAVVGAFILFVHAVLTKQIKFKHFVVLMILFFIVYNAFLAEFFEAGIAARIESYSGSTRVLAGRTDTWRSTIKDASIFGYGFEYFSQYLQIQAHNDVLQFVGMYGIPSGLLLACFYLLTAMLGLEFSVKKYKKEYAVIPLMFVIGYIALGSAETVIGFNAKTPAMVFLNFVGVLLLYL